MRKALALMVLSGLMFSAIGGNAMVNAEKMDQELAGYETLSNGLKMMDEKMGNGDEAGKGDQIKVHYTGTLFPSGKKFDSSVDRGQPFQFKLGVGQVIPGWDQGVTGMKEGGKRVLIIPSDLAYGDRGVPPTIPPKATLKFEVELLEVSSK